MPKFKQVLIPSLPFKEDLKKRNFWFGWEWEAKWIGSPTAEEAPAVWVFRLKISLPKAGKIRLHATADERYDFLIDGQLIGRGPDRCEPNRWCFATYDIQFEAGAHILVARVWALGEKGPYAQMSVLPGFILAAEGPLAEKLDTGRAPWEVKALEGYSWPDQPKIAFDGFTGRKTWLDGTRYSWDWETGQGKGWKPAKVNAKSFVPNPSDLTPTRLLWPTMLPPQFSQNIRPGKVRHVELLGKADPGELKVQHRHHNVKESARWEAWWKGAPLTLAPHARYRIVIDLDDYYNAYPFLLTSGGKGSRVCISWAESLFLNAKLESKGRKDNRNEIEGRYFSGFANVFNISGGKKRRYDTLWWQCGRYLEIVAETGNEALTLHSLNLEETRYPMEMESRFSCDDSRWPAAERIMLRGYQSNAHEIFSDCPYYEQLSYVGDTALDALVNYVISPDDRLTRKSLVMFGASAIPGGLTQSRYPCRVRQIIPPFSLIWVLMLCRHARWRGDKELLLPLMPAARGVIDAFLRFRNKAGLVEAPTGWNFMDWPKDWDAGIPPDGWQGVSGVLNWLFVVVLARFAELEAYLGEPEMAARAERLAKAQATKSTKAFWNEKRGLIADDLKHRHFSEHAQTLALLSGLLPRDRVEQVGKGLLMAKGLTKATIYFSFYVMEAYRLLGRVDQLWKRLDLWFGLDDLGFKTTPEEPEPSRSDCHAWGAHPLFHVQATVLGVRPASPGFKTVEVRPQLGPLKHVKGRLVHPRGWIESEWTQTAKGLQGSVSLPKGCSGKLIIGKKTIPLKAGLNRVG